MRTRRHALPTCRGRQSGGGQRGAALLLAMVILTLVSTLAAGMVWQQTRAVQIEGAERARAQAEWILSGALDWSRLILREDQRAGGADHLGEPWATPLAEARLSSFLAADAEDNTELDLDVFLSGSIVDAQSRYNLRNLIDGAGKVIPVELRALERLCEAGGLPGDTAGRLSEGLRAAWALPTEEGDEPDDAPLAPLRVSQLTWLGLDAATTQRLEPWLTLLPVRTTVNVNTAPREVLLAAIDGLDLATAERLVQVRQRNPFRRIEEITGQLPETLKAEPARIGVRSSFFEVSGRLRLADLVIEEQSLLERRGADRGFDVLALRRTRTTVQTSAAAAPEKRPVAGRQ